MNLKPKSDFQKASVLCSLQHHSHTWKTFSLYWKVTTIVDVILYMYHVPVLRYTSAYITLLLEEQFILDISVSAHIACKGHRRIS